MSEYWIERREVGWRRYRVLRRGKTFAALFTGGSEEATTLVGHFFTRRGAERRIARVTWTMVREDA